MKKIINKIKYYWNEDKRLRKDIEDSGDEHRQNKLYIWDKQRHWHLPVVGCIGFFFATLWMIWRSLGSGNVGLISFYISLSSFAASILSICLSYYNGAFTDEIIENSNHLDDELEDFKSLYRVNFELLRLENKELSLKLDQVLLEMNKKE